MRAALLVPLLLVATTGVAEAKPAKGIAFTARGYAGGAVRNVFALPLGSVAAGGALGFELRRSAWTFTVDGSWSAMELPLSYWQVHYGFAGEGKIGRARLGAGIRSGFIFIPRVTRDYGMNDVTLGGRVFFSYDLHRFPHAGTVGQPALYLLLEGTVDGFLSELSPPTGSLTVGVGIRY